MNNFQIPKELWGNFVCDGTGRPVEFSTNSIVELATDTDKYAFEDKTRLNFHYFTGLDVTIPETTAQKITSKLTCASRAVLAATKITLRRAQSDVVENLPLLKIIEKNQNGFTWRGYTGLVNISESTLTNHNASAIAANTGVELIIYYLKLKGRENVAA